MIGRGEEVRVLYLVLPWSKNIGWGVCSKHITRELAKLTEVRFISDRFDPQAARDPVEYRFFQELRAGDDEISALKENNREHPVLQAIRDHQLAPFHLEVTGPLKIGYTFFEANLAAEDVARAMRYFDVIAAGSEWCASMLREQGVRGAVPVIQGIDPLTFNPSFAEKEYFRDRFVVFSGGKFEYRKGHDVVIRAYKVLQDRHPDVMLVAAWYNPWDPKMTWMKMSSLIQVEGQSKDHEANLRETLHCNGIDVNRVIFVPACSHETMARVYQNTDVGLFPNRCEGGTNLVLMEYMACAKPVIASYTSGHKDILREENSLLLKGFRPIGVNRNHQRYACWDDPDLDEVVHQLEVAYERRETLRRTIAVQAGEDLANFTWTRTARGFLRLVEGEGPPRSPAEGWPSASA